MAFVRAPEFAATAEHSGEKIQRAPQEIHAGEPIEQVRAGGRAFVTRPLTDAEEYDVDLVCRLEASKADFTQKSLKEAVGREVALYAEAHSMGDPEEQRRCWTLNYAASAQFHMDILPACPTRSATRPSSSGRVIARSRRTAG